MPRISRKTQQKRGADRDSAKGPKRTSDEALQDQCLIYSLWKEGCTLDGITETLRQLRTYAISRRTVERDLKGYRETLFSLTENKEDFKRARKRELTKLDREESLVMQVWHRSLKATIRREVGTVGANSIDKSTFEEYEDGTIAEGLGDLTWVRLF